MTLPRTNILLEMLSDGARRTILAKCKEIELPMRTSLQSQEEEPRHAYLLTSGVASVVVRHDEGASSETLLLGREGIAGALSLLGGARPVAECFMQVQGSGYQMPLGELRELVLRNEEIRRRVLECVQQQSLTTMQIAACNVAHDAESRLARWLLMIRDRTGAGVFQLTQEFVAQMLGAQRTTVALAAGALQRSGMIEYTRGRVHILCGEDLERAACECYGVTRRLMETMYRPDA